MDAIEVIAEYKKLYNAAFQTALNDANEHYNTRCGSNKKTREEYIIQRTEKHLLGMLAIYGNMK